MRGWNPTESEINDLAQKARAGWRQNSKPGRISESPCAGTPSPEPPTTRRKINEADVTKQIRGLLKHCRVWHYKQFQTLGSFRGVSDIIGIYRNRFLAIEVKAPGWTPPGPTAKGWKHYQEQSDFLEHVRSNGGIGFFATKVEDVLRALELEARVMPLFDTGRPQIAKSSHSKG